MRKQSKISYCDLCKKDTKHYIGNGRCRSCAIRSAFTVLECKDGHGLTKHRGGKCAQCANEALVSMRECENGHGVTKFQGNNCCKCANSPEKFDKRHCEKCEKITTHQSGTCMECNRGGFAKGEYANNKRCVWDSLRGCSRVFRPSSGRQEACKETHYPVCKQCSKEFPITVETKFRFSIEAEGKSPNTSFRRVVVDGVVCEDCWLEFRAARVIEGNKKTKTSYQSTTRICALNHLDLHEDSNCSKFYHPTSFHQRICFGDHFVPCRCGNPVEVAFKNLSSPLKDQNLYCYECSQNNRFCELYCDKCEAIKLHTMTGVCCYFIQ